MTAETLSDQKRQRTTLRVSQVVRDLMVRRGINQTQLAKALGLQQSGISGRLNGRISWSADEIDSLATVLGAPPVAFVVGLPQLDSNQQPADWGTEQRMPDTPSEGLWSPLPVAA